MQRVDPPEIPPKFPNDKFIYGIIKTNGCLKYETGFVSFCECRTDASVESDDFSGCMMMAFRFKQPYKCQRLTGEYVQGVPQSDYVYVAPGTDYIAHVYCNSDGDMKKEIFNAEKKGYIEVEALYKPFNDEDSENLRNAEKLSVAEKQISFKGSMNRDENGKWIADVYAPQNGAAYDAIKGSYLQHDDSNKRLKHFDSDALHFETLATKAMVYASVIVQNNTLGDVATHEAKKEAWNDLKEIASAEMNIIQHAMSLVKENSKEHKILKASTINE